MWGYAMNFFVTLFGSCIAAIATAVGVLTLIDGPSAWTAVFFGIAVAHVGFVLFVRRSGGDRR